MNSYNKGLKVFKVFTNYDYYLLQHRKTNTNITTINDFDEKIYDIDLNKWDFIPNGKFKEIGELLAVDERSSVIHDCIYHNQRTGINDKGVCVIYNRTMYDTIKDIMNNDEGEIFKYPCVYTINQKNGVCWAYSNIDKGHFGIPKVIWSNGRGSPFIDYDGKYGLTQFAYAIVDEKENLPKILETLLNKDFIKLMSYLIFKKAHRYNYKVIALFKKDFYKHFIST